MSNTISSVSSASDWMVTWVAFGVPLSAFQIGAPAYGDDYGVFWVV